MKKQSLRRSGSTPSIPVRHQFDHVVPTVIHDPEEKMTTLGRWTHRLLKDPKRAGTWAAVIVGGLLLGVVSWNVIGTASRTSDFWTRLEKAKSTDDRIALAKENPTS